MGGKNVRCNFNLSKLNLIACGFNVAHKYLIYFINVCNSMHYYAVVESCTEVKNIMKYNLKSNILCAVTPCRTGGSLLLLVCYIV